MSSMSNRRNFLAFLPSGAALAGQRSSQPQSASRGRAASVPEFELDEITIDDLQRGMQTGKYLASAAHYGAVSGAH